MIPRSRYPFVIALALGLTYALVTRFVAATHVSGLDIFKGGLLSIAFVLVMPLALGAITAHFIPPGAVSRGERLAWAPLLSVLLFLVSALLFKLEGLICVVIISPLYLLLSWLGAFGYASLTDASRERRNKVPVLAAFVLLPYLVGPAERLFAAPDSYRLVENYIDIAAPAPVVWQHIIQVAPIDRRALGHSPIDILGFPHPVEATLSHEGVGGVRHATFERGVEFIETVDDWQPLRRLSFSIVPNTATIPPTTFDEHVTVGGQYFDVLRGTYELQPLGPGRTRLVLVSEQRLSTHLNWYAGLWTRYIMSEIQARILGVLKQRCEAAAPTAVAAARP